MEVLVLARYCAQTEDELSLAQGDVVRQVCAGPSRGWLHGELRGRRGLFPKRLVQEIPEALRGVTEPRPRCARRRGHPIDPRGPQRWCKVNFNYGPVQADELKLQSGEIVEVIKEIEDGWWLGKKNGQLGAFPSNFVELLDSGPPSLGNTDMPSVIPSSQRPRKLSTLTYDSPPDYLRTVSCPETCRVLFDYQPEAPDELALQKGDLVKVLRKTTEDKGWWEGECRGRRGVFPDNFVLPPPPIKKLVPRKIISPEPAHIKEPKKLMPRTFLPNTKKLAASASAPSKAKTSSTPSGDSQKRPSRDSGFKGSFLNGGAQPTMEKEIQNPSFQPALCIQSGTQLPNETPSLPSPQEEEQRSLRKTPSRNKTFRPGKTQLPDKNRGSEKISAPDKVSIPENPIPEKALHSDEASASENTAVDEVVTPERALSVDADPALKSPTKDETLDQKMPLHVDSAPVLVKILTPEHMFFIEDSPRDNTQSQHLSQEETTPGSESLASQNDIQVPGEYPQQPNSSESSCYKVKQEDSSPDQSKAKGESAVQVLEGSPAEDETTLKTILPKEELPSEGVGLQKQVPPKESVPTPQVPHTIKQIPDPEEDAALHPVVPPTSSETKNDSVDIALLKEEVGSLKSTLERLGLQLEQKLGDVWEELNTKKERLQLLEAQMLWRPQTCFKNAQTQTETQTE